MSAQQVAVSLDTFLLLPSMLHTPPPPPDLGTKNTPVNLFFTPQTNHYEPVVKVNVCMYILVISISLN